jgi:hypothetical protein
MAEEWERFGTPAREPRWGTEAIRAFTADESERYLPGAFEGPSYSWRWE